MRELFRKLQIVAALALGCAPVALVLFTYTAPSFLPLAWVFSGAYFILAMLGILIPGKWRLLYGVLIAGVCLVTPVPLVQWESLPPLLIAVLLYLLLFASSLTIGGWQSDGELPLNYKAICFGFHLVAQFVVIMDRQVPKPVLTSHVPGLQCAFWAFIFLAVLSQNRISMNNASTVSQRVSPGIRRKNVVMTLVLFVLAILASFIPYIYDWIKALVLWVVALLLRLLALLRPVQQSGGGAPPAGSPESMPPVEQTASGPLGKILEVLFWVIGVLLFIVILAFAVYWIGRKLMGLTRQLWDALERYAATVSEDYLDEITDTRREVSETGTTRGRRSAMGRQRKKPQNPGEAIRYRYRRLLSKHPEWTASTTARENIPLDWAEIYEQARYSGRAITETDAERFQSGTKRL